MIDGLYCAAMSAALFGEARVIKSTPDLSAAIEQNIYWPVLTGEDAFWAILDSEGIPSRIKTQSERDIQRRGRHVYQTAGWRYFKPYFFDALDEVINTAETQDIWTPDQEDEWEKFKKREWEAELDALPQIEKDSLWINNQRRYWEGRKELIWKNVKPYFMNIV